MKTKFSVWLLSIGVGVIAGCAMCYEYLISTYAGYTLGSAFKEVFLIISLMMFAMFLGNLATKKIRNNLVEWFLATEILIAFVGGVSIFTISGVTSAVNYLPSIVTQTIMGKDWVYLNQETFFTAMFFETLAEAVSYFPYFFGILVGYLVGMEIPLVMRIVNSYKIEFKDTVGNILAADSLGSLAGGLLWIFVFITMPLTRAGFMIGLLNGVVALICTIVFLKEIRWKKSFAFMSVALILGLFLGLSEADNWEANMEQMLYEDKILVSFQTKYQRGVVTEWRVKGKGSSEVIYDYFSNGNLQFSSRDEDRYHEMLIHPAMLLTHERSKILVLGGGDGMALRELLKYPEVKRLVLVDIDKQVTDFFTHHPNGKKYANLPLVELNNYAFSDQRVEVVNKDAYIWLDENSQIFDRIFIDFPDPNHIDLNKLYTWGFYKKVQRHLSANGFVAIQATSPIHAREAYLCIGKTMEKSGFRIIPYHVNVPSFGEWGFYLAWKNKRMQEGLIHSLLDEISQKDIFFRTKFLSPDAIKASLYFWKGMFEDYDKIRPNYMRDPALVAYYEKGWKEDY